MVGPELGLSLDDLNKTYKTPAGDRGSFCGSDRSGPSPARRFPIRGANRTPTYLIATIRRRNVRCRSNQGVSGTEGGGRASSINTGA
ncbi:unnamed protein product [Ilex paraguariensis]|uniref:Uncharacterized protein n=1 Tax=Ilex paraguariensis TaxID=185542 RepID=A0ABC8T999_9AQUA